MKPWTLRDLRRLAARGKVCTITTWYRSFWDGDERPSIQVRGGHVSIGGTMEIARLLDDTAPAERGLDRLIAILGPDWPLRERRNTDKDVETGHPTGGSAGGGQAPDAGPATTSAQAQGAGLGGGGATGLPTTDSPCPERSGGQDSAAGRAGGGEPADCGQADRGAEDSPERSSATGSGCVADHPGNEHTAQLSGADYRPGMATSPGRKISKWTLRVHRMLSSPDPKVRRKAISLLARHASGEGAGPAGGRTGGSGSFLSALRPVERADAVRLMAALRAWLGQEPGGLGEPSPRLDAERLVRELASRRLSIGRARKREMEPARSILAVDTSQSCSVYCDDTMAAALAVHSLDPRLVVVEHSNGDPLRILMDGRWQPLDVGYDEDVVCSWWTDTCERLNVSRILWVGDADGMSVREAIAAKVRIGLADNYTASLGRVRPAPSHWRENHCEWHAVGVSNAGTLADALRLARHR